MVIKISHKNTQVYRTHIVVPPRWCVPHNTQKDVLDLYVYVERALRAHTQ